MVARRIEAPFPGLDESIWIRHTTRVTSQYEHVRELAALLAGATTAWITTYVR